MKIRWYFALGLIGLLLLIFTVNCLGLSRLKELETAYFENPNDPRAAARYGEALYYEDFVTDAVTYIEKAFYLGYESPSREEILKKAHRYMLGTKSAKVCMGWLPSLSPDGKSITYLVDESWKNGSHSSLWLYNFPTRKKSKICDLTDDQVYVKWDSRSEKIAAIDGLSIIIADIKKGIQWSDKIPGQPVKNSLLWFDDSDRLLLLSNEFGDSKVLLYNLKRRKSGTLASADKIFGITFFSSKILIAKDNSISEISIAKKHTKIKGFLPNGITLDSLITTGKRGIGFSTGKNKENHFYGNDPILTDYKNIWTTLSFPNSDGYELGISKKGNLLAVTEGTGLAKDNFSVLWLASTDGIRCIPIDSGEINFVPWAFSDNEAAFVYSKGEKASAWVYLVSLKLGF